jgi:hypothetical protein
VQRVGEIPFENLIVDFTEMKIFAGVCLYLLRMGGSLPYLD